MALDSQTLAHIAKDAPLSQTLDSLVQSIEASHPEIFLAILQIEHSDKLHVSAAPSLPAEYRTKLNGAVTERMTHLLADTRNTSNPWSAFYETANQHGLAIFNIVAIRGRDQIHGLCIAYVRSAEAKHNCDQQAIIDAANLAAIAIERHSATKKIRKAEDALRHNETIMALAIEGSNTGIWDRNIQTNQINYSNGWKAILGYSPSEVSNRIEDSYTRIHPDDLDFVKAAMQAHFDHKTESYAVEHRIRCKDGSYKWISSRGKIVQHDAAGKPLRMVGTTTDITAIRTLAEELQQSVKLITSLTNEVPGLVFQYRLMPNGDAFFSYASEGVKDIYELDAKQIAEDSDAINQLIHLDDLPKYKKSLQESAANLKPWHLEYRVILPRQGLRWRQGDARPRRLEDGSVLWHGFITDITERKRIELELEGFATIDFLTQIPNRRFFISRMEEELTRIQRVKSACAAVLMCDLDHFKNVNDQYGHAVGDLVLKHFAVILRNATRKIDTAGRVGGEEFAVVLADAGVDEALVFAKRILEQTSSTPVLAGDAVIYITVSIGIAIMNAHDGNTADALSRSDTALYRAKDNGRNRVEVNVL